MDNPELSKEIGARIKKLREQNNENQKDLASAINLTQDAISKIERGEVRLTIENQVNIAQHYHVSHDYLCTGADNSTILDILNKFINLKLTLIHEGDESFQYPVFKINDSFFSYLLQLATINSQKELPSYIRDLWIKDITDKFFSKIKNGNYTNSENFVPLSEHIVQGYDDKNDWKRADLLQAINSHINKLKRN